MRLHPMRRTVELDPAQLVWHEELEHPRLRGLLDALERGQRVPAIDVVPIGEQYLIIDGAHRARAAARHGRTVTARLREIAPGTLVPGWSHAIPEPMARRLARDPSLRGTPGDAADIVATLQLDGQRSSIITTDSSAAGRHAAFHRVAGTAYRMGHERLQKPSAPRPPGSGVLSWQALTWEQIVEVATTVGVLPAGVTRFAAVTGR